jgi:5'-nucleotidase
MFKGAKYRVSPEKGRTTQDVLRDAFASAESIAPATDGRIERLRGGARDVARKDDENAPVCPSSAHAAE